MTSTRAKAWLSLSGKYKKFLAENVQSCFVLSIRKSSYNIDHWDNQVTASWHQLLMDELHCCISCHLSNWESLCESSERSIISVCHPPFITFALFCHHVQSLCVSRSWRQRLWCRHRGTVVSGRHGPRTWPRKPPNPLQDARTPMDLHCHRGNCPHASPAGCCLRRACGLWRHHGNAGGSDDEGVRRWAPAAGS